VNFFDLFRYFRIKYFCWKLICFVGGKSFGRIEDVDNFVGEIMCGRMEGVVNFVEGGLGIERESSPSFVRGCWLDLLEGCVCEF